MDDLTGVVAERFKAHVQRTIPLIASAVLDASGDARQQDMAGRT
jgi:hypothetical protein